MPNILALEGAFQLRADDTLVSSDPVLLQAAKRAFAEDYVCYFRNIVDRPVLAQLMAVAEASPYEREDVPGLGHRLQEAEDRIGSTVRRMLMRPQLRAWMTAAGDCDPLIQVSGRFVEAEAGGGQGLIWHNDMADRHRRMAVVLNLSSQPFEGGEFEMGRAGDPAPMFSFTHFEPGSALIFRLADHMFHRVLPVTKGGPRRVFAGWFEAETELPGGPIPNI